MKIANTNEIKNCMTSIYVDGSTNRSESVKMAAIDNGHLSYYEGANNQRHSPLTCAAVPILKRINGRIRSSSVSDQTDGSPFASHND